MKRTYLFVIAAFLLGTSIATAFADEYVRGYTRQDGTYVAPYYRSSPDDTVTNNYSFEGNTNPYTGKVGTNRYEHDTTSPYFQGPDANGNEGHDSEPNDDSGSDDQ